MHNRAYSVNEAAFVTERPAKVLTREFDEGVFNANEKPKELRARYTARKFTPEDLRYFRLMKYWGNDFSPDLRRSVFHSMRSLSLKKKVLELRNARYDLAPIDAELKAREASLEALKARFVAMDGDVVFKGTDISAYRVAALNKSQTIEDIAEDYPSLTIEMVRAAIDYAEVYPKKGKPYPSLSLKRTLSHMANGLDEETLDVMFGSDGTDSSGD